MATIRLAHTLIDSVDNKTVLDPEVLSDLDKENGNARVLADRDVLFSRDAGVLLQEFNDLFGTGRGLGLDRPVKGGKHKSEAKRS